MVRETRGQKGQAIVLIALMLGVVVGMAALAIDGSRAYALRRDLQAAADGAALTAADSYQRSGAYITAEQASSAAFGVNLRIYGAPVCTYGSPGASPFTVTCAYADGTTLTDVVSALGPRGAQFQLTAARPLSLQFARILTNGTTPTISAPSTGRVNDLLYSPTLAALEQDGCGGLGGAAITVNGSGTLSVTGDVVTAGSISVVSGSAVVAGDIYARCQGSVAGMRTACYPSRSGPPCTFPDVAGAVRSGYRYVDPNFPPPAVVGGGQGAPASNTSLSPGTYSSNPSFVRNRCWFLTGGVYDWMGGFTNSNDLVSNELKPPSEPSTDDNTEASTSQFWDGNGVNCAGSFQTTSADLPTSITRGKWGVELTSVRNDTYSGTSYRRESAPSVCQVVNVKGGDAIRIDVSNLPGPTSYNVYLSLPNNGCSGPFGLAGNIPVSGTISNSNTNPCPTFNGNGCSLGHETAIFDSTVVSVLFAPNSGAAPGTYTSYPPDPETTPLAAGLPNQNPARGVGATGDRANENNCDSLAGALVSCAGPITPGAVVFYLPSGACLNNTNGGNDNNNNGNNNDNGGNENNGNGGDSYVFSGYQYNWMSVYEPGAGYPPANVCSNSLGGSSNTAFVGVMYMPSASLAVTSHFAFESGGIGGIIADSITFNGTLPSINFNAGYAPVPFAARIVS